MLVSHRHRFVFIHVYKVAGTSMRRALERFCEDRWKRRAARVLSGRGLYRPNLPPAHLTAREARDHVSQRVFDNYFTFAFVRNPWDWQVSLYHYMRKVETHHQHEVAKRLAGFDDYIRWRVDEEVRLQKAFVVDERERVMVDFIGRMERIGEDFRHICRAVGLPPVRLPHQNRSGHRDYRTYYNDHTRELVARAFAEDIALFGYTFDGPVADHRRRAAAPSPVRTAPA
jgi:Sulfotransferase family